MSVLLWVIQVRVLHTWVAIWLWRGLAVTSIAALLWGRWVVIAVGSLLWWRRTVAVVLLRRRSAVAIPSLLWIGIW